MFHIDGDTFAIAMALQVRSDLEILSALWAARHAARFDGDHFRAMFGEQAGQRRPDDAGRKTDNANSLEGLSAPPRAPVRRLLSSQPDGWENSRRDLHLMLAEQRRAPFDAPRGFGKFVGVAGKTHGGPEGVIDRRSQNFGAGSARRRENALGGLIGAAAKRSA